MQRVQYGPLSAIVKNAAKKHTATVIFSHGLGDSGSGWSFLPSELPSLNDHVKYIFPTAKSQPVSVNGGMSMNSWYDIYELGSSAGDAGSGPRRVDKKGLLESVGLIRDIIKKELADTDIPPERIVVGGFSQGSAVSLLCGVTSPMKLAGIAVMSGYLAQYEGLGAEITQEGKDMMYFWGHGKSDPVVMYEWATRSQKVLKEEYNVNNIEFNSYAGLQHSASPQELKDLETFLNKVIPAKL